MFLCKANKEGLFRVLVEVFMRKRVREEFKRNEPLVGVINVDFIVRELLRWSMDPQAYEQRIENMQLFLPNYGITLAYDRGDTMVFVMFSVLDTRRLLVNTRVYNVWHTYIFDMRPRWVKLLEGKSLGELFKERKYERVL